MDECVTQMERHCACSFMAAIYTPYLGHSITEWPLSNPLTYRVSIKLSCVHDLMMERMGDGVDLSGKRISARRLFLSLIGRIAEIAA